MLLQMLLLLLLPFSSAQLMQFQFSHSRLPFWRAIPVAFVPLDRRKIIGSLTASI